MFVDVKLLTQTGVACEVVCVVYSHILPIAEKKNRGVSSVHDKGVKVSYDANCECMVEYMINKTHRITLCIP